MKGLTQIGLVMVWTLFSPLWLNAQSPAAGSRILIETDPSLPAAGGRWTLTLLVDHPRPGEVEIRPPRFPEALFPEQNRRESRLVENRRWTAAEYRFILGGPGVVTLPPFEVVTPLGRSRTSPLTLTIRAAGEGEFQPRLEWEPVPPRLETGKSRELFLRLAGWDPRRTLPPAALFFPPVPEGAILEAEDPGPGNREAGRVLRLRIIPLSGPRFTLPGRSIRYGGLLLDIPPLSLPVYESGAAPGSPAPPALGGKAGNPVPPPGPALAPAPGAEIFQVPLAGASLFRRIFRFACGPQAERVQSLWEAGDRVRALAELRRFERDHPAGPLLKSLRRNMETALGLERAADEKWRPRALLLLGLLGGLIGAGAGMAIRFFRPPAFRRAGIFVIIALGLAGICAWGLATGRGFPPGKSSGIVRETPARRIPDPAGEEVFFFPEGRRVKVRPGGGSWVWAEAPDAGAGWVPRERLVFY